MTHPDNGSQTPFRRPSPRISGQAADPDNVVQMDSKHTDPPTESRSEAPGSSGPSNATAEPNVDPYETHPLSVDDIRTRLFELGISKSKDSIQRYCREGRLDCIKLGLFRRYYVTEASVDRLIETFGSDAAAHSFIQLHAGVESDQEKSLQLHSPAADKNIDQPNDLHAAALPGMQVHAGADSGGRSNELRDGETADRPTEPEVAITSSDPGLIDFMKEQLKVKDEQIRVKDEQIAGMLERDRETNILIRGLQDNLGEVFGLLMSGKPQTRIHPDDDHRYEI